ncbi:hypothetical protein MNR01_06015 [Lysobacter sp. S4-A87]|uniref:hypothetical protein n=1 Tax=Lysobacter sp. S4-A87 TaxID=2925843 RepID=UPI001F539C07|nr:hypothetical protein [Lysobacter sp. S4-A87]UNK50560.1 hypothetical protein MNR01_06015 [Lysobacter sp. S4-A87]
MDVGLLGFFAGAAPGVLLALRNMGRVRRAYRHVEKLAAEEGKYFNMDLGFRDKKTFVFEPDQLIEAGDSERLKVAKLELIEQRRHLIRRHFFCFLIIAVGAIAGVVTANAIQTLASG